MQGTYLKHGSKCYAIKNLEEKEYMFQCNNLNSTYFHHTDENDKIEKLVLEVRICEDKIK